MKDNKENQTIEKKDKSEDTKYIEELVKIEKKYSLKALQDKKIEKKLSELSSY